MYHLGKKSRERLQGVNPVLIELIEDALKVSPIDFGIPRHGGLRTAQDQHELWQKGRILKNSTLNPSLRSSWEVVNKSQVITYTDGYERKSYHQSGNAFDVYAFINNKASWKKHHLAMVAGALMSKAKKKGINLEWGASFRSSTFDGFDFPHFQIS